MANALDRYHDYTKGTITRNIWLLAAPMMLEQVIMGTYQLLDGIWVGRLGSAELAALGICGTLNFVLTSLAMGLGVGATASVARRVGEQDLGAASHAAWQILFLASILAAIIGTLGFLLARPLLVLLGTEEQVAALGTGYLRILYLGLLATMLTQSSSAILRGSGEARFALKAMVLGYGLSLVLDPLLILGFGPIPGLGLRGGALAVVLGALSSFLFALHTLTSGRIQIRLVWRAFHLDFPLMWRIIKIGLPSSLQTLFRSASRLTVVGIIATFGTAALAAYSATTRVLMFTLIPCFGLANAASTLVGQNLGAGKPERSARSAWLIGGYGMAYMGAMAVVTLGMPTAILRLFSTDPQVLSVGTVALRVIGITQVTSSLGVVMGGALTGAGDTMPPMLVNLGTLWGVQIPMAYLLSRTPFGINGIWAGLAVADLANALLLAFWFHRGGWRRRKV